MICYCGLQWKLNTSLTTMIMGDVLWWEKTGHLEKIGSLDQLFSVWIMTVEHEMSGYVTWNLVTLGILLLNISKGVKIFKLIWFHWLYFQNQSSMGGACIHWTYAPEYALRQVISCVIKACTWHHLIHAKCWHHFSDIRWPIEAKWTA